MGGGLENIWQGDKLTDLPESVSRIESAKKA